MALDVAAVQEALRADGLDGWLLYDFHGSNPIAGQLTGLTGGAHMTTRRWYYLIPATRRAARAGACHRAPQPRPPARREDGLRRPAAARRRADRLLAGMHAGGDGILAEVRHPLPVAGRRRHGRGGPGARGRDRFVGRPRPTVRGRAGRRLSWRPTRRRPTRSTGSRIGRSRRRAAALRPGAALSEYDLQQQMVGWFEDEGLVSDSPPVVAVGGNAGNPHYLPTAGRDRGRSSRTRCCCSICGANSEQPGRGVC